MIIEEGNDTQSTRQEQRKRVLTRHYFLFWLKKNSFPVKIMDHDSSNVQTNERNLHSKWPT